MKHVISKRAILPYVRLAEQYIAEHRDEPDIKHAIDWLLNGLMLPSAEYANSRLSKNQVHRMKFWTAKLWHRLCDPEEVLAVVAGMFLHRAVNGRDYPKSDDRDAERYWRMNLARRVLFHHRKLGGKNSKGQRAANNWQWHNKQPSETVLLMLAYLLLRKVGLTAKQIADALMREHELKLVEEIKQSQEKNLRGNIK